MPAKSEYSDEFKKEAIRLLESSGKRLTDVERELGIPHGLIRKWQRRFQVNPVSDELELSQVTRLEAEVRALKRELEITRMEREILKKTVSIFSKESR
jgi:transposase